MRDGSSLAGGPLSPLNSILICMKSKWNSDENVTTRSTRLFKQVDRNFMMKQQQ